MMTPLRIAISLDYLFNMRDFLFTPVWDEMAKREDVRFLLLSRGGESKQYIQQRHCSNVSFVRFTKLAPYKVYKIEKLFDRLAECWLDRFWEWDEHYLFHSLMVRFAAVNHLAHYTIREQRSLQERTRHQRFYYYQKGSQVGEPWPKSRMMYRLLYDFRHSLLNPILREDLAFLQTLNLDLFVFGRLHFMPTAYWALALRRIGVPMVGIVSSWDHPTTQGPTPRGMSGYVVASKWMAREMVEFHRINPDKIVQVGKVQMDLYKTPSILLRRDDFLSTLDIPNDHKLITLATNTTGLKEHEISIAQKIAQDVMNGRYGKVTLLIRPHPQDKLWQEHFLPLTRLPWVICMQSYPLETGASMQALKDQIILANLMMHSDVVIQSRGSIALDAVAFDTPVISLAFDGDLVRKPNDSFLLEYSYHHYRPIVNSEGTWMVGSYEALDNAIKSYLADPGLHSEGRKKIRDDHIEPLDGNSSRRLVNYLITMAEKARDGTLPKGDWNYSGLGNTKWASQQTCDVEGYVRRCVNTSDSIGKATMTANFSEVALLQRFGFISDEDNQLVDVGAHIGTFSIPFAAKGWKVVAFEPELENYQALCTNTRSFPKVTCIQKAVSDVAEKDVLFYVSPEHFGIHSLKPFHATHNPSMRVETVRLDKYLEGMGVNEVTVLKIDVEGADFLVLKSFDFDKMKPPIVVCEFMDERSHPNYGYTHHDMSSYMSERGYKTYVAEWAPIVEYGRKGVATPPHRFLRCDRYPLDHQPAWGNLIFVREDYITRFEGVLGCYLFEIGSTENKFITKGTPKDHLDRSIKLLGEYQDIHKGQRCIIIGNGPSLNKMDMSFLKDEITFGMNRIYLGFEKWGFIPSYYVSVNPLVIEQSEELISQIPCPKFLSMNGLPYLSHPENFMLIKSLDNPSVFKELQIASPEQQSLFNNRGQFSTDPRVGIFEGYTVTYVAMQLAYYMGFQEVYLIGVDHSFTTKGVPNKEVKSQGEDSDHFAPNYFGKGVRWNLPDLENSEKSYRLAKQVFESGGRQIFDATVDGKLNVFPKVDYRKILSSNKVPALPIFSNFNIAQDHPYLGEWTEKIIGIIKQADQHLGEGDVVSAQEALSQAINLLPHDPWMIVNLGNLKLQQGDIESARREFVKATILAPNYAHGHAMLGLVLVYLKRSEEAEKALRRALALNPNDKNTQDLLELVQQETQTNASALAEQSSQQPAQTLKTEPSLVIEQVEMVKKQEFKFRMEQAEETLKLLLNADDLFVALRDNETRLDSNVLSLVRRDLETARLNGETDLAEGLENLTEYIKNVLARSIAPQAVSINRSFLDKQREFWSAGSMYEAMFKKVFTDEKIERMTDEEKWESWNQSSLSSMNQILEDLPTRPEWKILEIGCGVGRVIKPLRERFTQVDGVDISEDMIRFGQQYLADSPGFGQLYLNNGYDLTALPDCEYNLVYSMIVFQHIRSVSIVRSYFREAMRVLKPGGYFRIQVHEWFPDLGHYDEEASPDFQYSFAGTGYTESELAQLLRDTGFDNIQTQKRSPWIWATAQHPEALAYTNPGTGQLRQVQSPSTRSAETLEILLNAGDLFAALEQHRDRLDASLLELVRQNNRAASADGNTELAEGLENLANYIEDVLTRRNKPKDEQRSDEETEKALRQALALNTSDINTQNLLAGIEQKKQTQSYPPITQRQTPIGLIQSHKFLVSAIVSTYNSEKFLRGCLEDLEAQTIADRLEIIVIDSASPQNERKIVEEFQQRYDNIVYIRNEQRETIYAAWNRGIAVARSKYLTNANTDDRHRPDAFEVMARALDEHPEVVVVYADQLITERPNETWASHTATRRWNWPEFSYAELEAQCIVGPQPMWRKTLHEKHGLFDRAFVSSGDYEFWLRIGKGERFYRIPEILGLYYNNPHSLEHASRKAAAERQRIKEQYGILARDVKPRQTIPVAVSEAELAGLPHRGAPSRLLVSVIIPCYDRPEVLRQCLAALQSQTLPREQFEVICVNDAASDSAVKKVIIEALQNLPGKYLEHPTNRGRGPARNTGLKEACGEIILLMDSDIVANSRLLEEHVWAHQSHAGEKIAVLSRIEFPPEQLAQSPVARVFDETTLVLAYSRMKPGKKYNYMHFYTGCVSFPRQAYVQLGGFDESYPHYGVEDTAYGYHLEQIGYAVLYHPAARCIHSEETSSVEKFCRRQKLVAANFCLFFHENPEALSGETWGGLKKLNAASLRTETALRDPQIPSLLVRANKLAALDLAMMDKTRQRRVMREMEGILTQLNGYYWDIGLIEGLAREGVSSFDELTSPASVHPSSFILQPSISVIIPTYNRSATLCKCLDALTRQTFPADQFEVIVCDDGSTDGTGQWIKTYHAPYRLVYLQQPNRGPGAARNMGLHQSVGEYILFLNDDAILEPSSLAVHHSVHLKYKEEKNVILGRFPLLPQYTQTPLGYLLENSELLFGYHKWNDGIIESLLPGQLLTHDWFYTCNISLSRQALFEVGLFDEDFTGPAAEDIEIGFRLAKKGYKVRFEPQSIAWHDHQHSPEDFCKVHRTRGQGRVTLCLKHPELNTLPDLDWNIIHQWQQELEKEQSSIDRALQMIKDTAGLAAQSNYDLAIVHQLAITIFPLVNLLREWSVREGIMSSPNLATLIEFNTHRKPGIRLLTKPGQAIEKVYSKRPFVSVVIPCYNYAYYLPEAVESVINQTYQNFEIIIVNDGSTDNTREVADQIIANHPARKIRLINQENSGQPAISRNRGIAAAIGQYILPLDADDKIAPTMLDECLHILETDSTVAIAYTDSIFFNEVKSWRQNYQDYDFQMLLYGNRQCYCALYRRQVWEAVGGYATNVIGYEDWDFWIACGEKGYFGKYISRPLFYYRVKEEGLYFANAVKNDARLKAQIVLNHPTLYSPEVVEHAQQFLSVLPIQNAFDEDEYLYKNEDVAEAVKRGQFRSGWEHYVQFGWKEGRLSNSYLWTPSSSDKLKNKVATSLPDLLSPTAEPTKIDSASATEHMPIPDGRIDIQRLVQPQRNKRSEQHLQAKDISILYVAHNFPTHHLAGTELYTNFLAQEMGQRGYSVRVLYPEYDTSRPENTITEDNYKGVPVTRINIHPNQDMAQSFWNETISKAFSQYLMSYKVDLIHFMHVAGVSPATIKACADLGKPAMMTLHDTWLLCEQPHYLRADGSFCEGPSTSEKCVQCVIERHPEQQLSQPPRITQLRQLMSLRRQQTQQAFDSIHTLVAPSQFIKQTILSNGFKHNNIEIAPLGLSPFQQLPKIPGSGLLRLTFIGNIVYHKGLDVVVNAFNLIESQKARLDIYGHIYDPITFERVMKLVSPDHLVIYHGAYSPDDLPQILSQTDVVIVPSRTEHYPTTVRESLHARVPVIAPAVGAVGELVQDEVNGFLFQPGDAKDLAEKINYFIQQPDEIDIFSKRIQPVWTIAQDASRLEEIYHQILEGAPELLPKTTITSHAKGTDWKVDIVVPVYGQPQLVRQCVESVLATTENAHLILVDDNSPGNEIQKLFREWSHHTRMTLSQTPTNLGFLGTCKHAAKLGHAPYILFLNSDTEAIEMGWLEKLIPSRDDIAIVGAKLLYPPSTPGPMAGKIQHAGVARDENGVPYHPFLGWNVDSPQANQPREVNAITGACFLVRRQIWDELGGWDPPFGRGVYEDVDLCWQARQKGYRVLYQPAACLYHHSCASEAVGGRHLLYGQNKTDNLEKLLTKWQGVKSDEDIFFGKETVQRWRRAREQINQAAELLDKRQFNQALNLIQKAVKTAPDNPEVLIGYAQLLAAQGKHRQAAEQIVKALEYAPGHWAARLRLVDEWVAANKPDLAAKELFHLRDVFPNELSIQQRAVKIAGYLEKTPQAVSLSSPSVSIFPSPTPVHNDFLSPPVAITPPKAAQTLEMFLEAEDLPAALKENEALLDEDLLDLVRRNATSARSDGNTALADGLDDLASYVAEVIAARQPSPEHTCQSTKTSPVAPEQLPAAPRPAETLRMLLEADDLAAALKEHKNKLDTSLLNLVLENARTARSDGNSDLAQGLDNLGEIIAEIIEGRKETSPKQVYPQADDDQTLGVVLKWAQKQKSTKRQTRTKKNSRKT